MYRFILQREIQSGLEDIEFPLAPEQFTTKVGNKNKTIDILKLGEVNIPKDIGLRTFSFKILLPKDETLVTGTKTYVDSEGNIQGTKSWVKMNFHEPIWYLSRLREIKANPNGKVFLVIIRELTEGYDGYGNAIKKQLFGGNIEVKMEDYTVEENAGEEGDYWVNINLKEHRKVGITQHIEETGSTDDEGRIEATEVKEREDTKEQPETYTVISGDSLWKIAQKYYGDGSRWREIYELNTDIISNPNNIKVGWVLKIKKPESE